MRRTWPLLPFLVVGTLALARGEDARPRDPWEQSSHDIRIVLIGNMQGKLKPCGCTKPQLGGLERLGAEIDRLRPGGHGVVAGVALGGFLSMTGINRQQEAKSALLREALREMGFQALCLGIPDLYQPAMFQSFEGDEGLGRPRPPVNVLPTRGSGIDLPGTSTAFVEFNVRTLPVRVLTLVDPDEAERLKAAGIAEGVITPSAALQGLQPHPDTLWIIGSYVSGEAAASMRRAAAGLGLTVIVDLTRESGSRPRDRIPLGGDPLVVSFDEMGKEVGVLDLDLPDAGKGWIATYRAVPLAPDLDESPSDLRPKIAALFDVYRQEIRERRVIDLLDTFPDGPAKWVGSAKCASCHDGIYRDWLTTPHAQAYNTLRKVDYHWDPECIVCHVQGARKSANPSGLRWIRDESGFRDPKKTAFLGAVGCENCHGPGSLHVARPDDKSLFAPGGPNRSKPDRETCIGCHDVDNSAGFQQEYEERLKKVDHRGVPFDRKYTTK